MLHQIDVELGQTDGHMRCTMLEATRQALWRLTRSIMIFFMQHGMHWDQEVEEDQCENKVHEELHSFFDAPTRHDWSQYQTLTSDDKWVKGYGAMVDVRNQMKCLLASIIRRQQGTKSTNLYVMFRHMQMVKHAVYTDLEIDLSSPAL